MATVSRCDFHAIVLAFEISDQLDLWNFETRLNERAMDSADFVDHVAYTLRCEAVYANTCGEDDAQGERYDSWVEHTVRPALDAARVHYDPADL